MDRRQGTKRTYGEFSGRNRIEDGSEGNRAGDQSQARKIQRILLERDRPRNEVSISEVPNNDTGNGFFGGALNSLDKHLFGGKKGEATQAYNEGCKFKSNAIELLGKLFDPSKEIINPDAEKLAVIIEKASGSLKELEKYKDKNTLQLVWYNIEKPIHDLNKVFDEFKPILGRDKQRQATEAYNEGCKFKLDVEEVLRKRADPSKEMTDPDVLRINQVKEKASGALEKLRECQDVDMNPVSLAESNVVEGAINHLNRAFDEFKSILGRGKQKQATEAYKKGSEFVSDAEKLLNKRIDLREGNTDPDVSKLGNIIEKACGPLEELKNYQYVNLVSLASRDVEKSIHDLNKVLDEFKPILGRDKQRQATEAYNEGFKYVPDVLEFLHKRADPSKEMTDPDVLKIKEIVEKASDAFKKLEEYKDMEPELLASRNVVKNPINDLKEALKSMEILGREKQKKATDACNLFWKRVSDARTFINKLFDPNKVLSQEFEARKTDHSDEPGLEAPYNEMTDPHLLKMREFLNKHFDPNKEITDPDVLQVKEATEKASGLFEELRNYQDMDLVSLGFRDVEKPIHDLRETVYKSIWLPLGRDKQKQATEAYNEACKFESYAKERLKEFYPDARLVINKAVKEASGPLEMLREYKDMDPNSLTLRDVEKSIHDLEAALKGAVELLLLASKKDQVTKACKEAGKFVSYVEQFLPECVDPKKEITDPKVLKMKEVYETVYSPLEELRNYQDMGLVLLALRDVEKPIKAFEEALEPIRSLGRDKQKQATDVYYEGLGLVSHAKRFLKQHGGGSFSEMRESIVNASDPLRELREYKNMDLVRFSLMDVKQPIDIHTLKGDLEEALSPIRNSEHTLPVGVRMIEDGKKYVIDPSKVEPADLKKLYLSNANEVTFEKLDHPENPKCSNTIPDITLGGRDYFKNHLRILPDLRRNLHAGVIYRTEYYNEGNKKLYERVLKFYLPLKLYATLGKTDLGEEKYKAWYIEEFQHAYKVLRSLNKQISESKIAPLMEIPKWKRNWDEAIVIEEM